MNNVIQSSEEEECKVLCPKWMLFGELGEHGTWGGGNFNAQKGLYSVMMRGIKPVWRVKAHIHFPESKTTKNEKPSQFMGISTLQKKIILP